MSFDSLTHVFSWLVGLALLVFFAGLLVLEVKTPPSHTVHIAIFAGGMGLALIVMGFAAKIAGGIQLVGAAAAPYLPFKKPGGNS